MSAVQSDVIDGLAACGINRPTTMIYEKQQRCADAAKAAGMHTSFESLILPAFTNTFRDSFQKAVAHLRRSHGSSQDMQIMSFLEGSDLAEAAALRAKDEAPGMRSYHKTCF